ncbi:MAG: DUF3604 domain-containing protein [Candidatus Schekmanbacteria bacterium]|nr:DUF3604 domain-containing protein [Candidatus Schekmanbacteria bacterium]
MSIVSDPARPRHTRKVLLLAAALLLGGALCAAAIALFVIFFAGHERGAGTAQALPASPAVVAARTEHQRPVAPENAKDILFGDLHVHTTFSGDAFLMSLPIVQGEGAHPPADACDYARICSGLDFWSITDHAEFVDEHRWAETKAAVRQCNAISGQADHPDLVTYLGWEWTQVGLTPESHFGHKNVIFLDQDDSKVPTRPIAASGDIFEVDPWAFPNPLTFIATPLLDFAHRQEYFDFIRFVREVEAVPNCPEGVDVHDLPTSCREVAGTPDALFAKLDQWGFESLVIPHGTTWGLYTPPGYTFDKSLKKTNHDPDRQSLIEVFSGHGNSETFRDWRDIAWDATGNPVCPAPRRDYEPCCWRAGDIVRSRCGDLPRGECDRRVEKAKIDFLLSGAAGHNAVPGTAVEDWGNCGQCTDCFDPSFNYRPGGSAQYALALTNFDDDANPARFHFGFLASSDNHSARPGTGYKEYARQEMTESAGQRDKTVYEGTSMRQGPKTPTSEAIVPGRSEVPYAMLADTERQASFFMTGGLVGVHAASRDRQAIWDGLKRREVYGTSGDRILLWFDLQNGPGGTVLPMGSKIHLGEPPKFKVRAVGALEQLPGCPTWSADRITPERLARLCANECFNPGTRRHRITRIEVIRIRPQATKGEDIARLIEDPWKSFPCADSDTGVCEVQFDDASFPTDGRDSVYYVRAIQEPTPAVNAGGLRCQEWDENGVCTAVKPCYGDYRTPYEDDCVAPNEERAWSSPIYVDR